MPRKPASQCRQTIGVNDLGKELRCPKIGNRSGYCPSHYRAWSKAALRCAHPSCNVIVTLPGNGPKAQRINGRRMVWPDGKTYSLCRKHEVLHLRLTPQIEELNLSRLGGNLEPGGRDGSCWIWKRGASRHTDSGYGLMEPEGFAGHDWYSHRVSFDMLNVTGWGHTQGQQVAHRCDTRACANIAHLEAATHSGNGKDKKKKRRGPSRAWWGPLSHNFAEQHGLPNPFPLPDTNPWDLLPLPAPLRPYGWDGIEGRPFPS